MSNRSDHLANERTFLAWIRTSIGIMAFGFVVVKFALFIKQVSFVLERGAIPIRQGYSYVMGISLVGFGALVGALSFIKYMSVEKQIDRDDYKPSLLLSILLIIAVLLMGLFLVIYLIQSTK